MFGKCPLVSGANSSTLNLMSAKVESATSTWGDGIGQPVCFTEDLRFLQGRGRYVDDLGLASDYQAVFLRNPHALARILNIDTSNAAVLPGVVAKFVGPPLKAEL
jgi:CO/xanthine dehydrogenase Mo-binding subunit